MSCSFFLLYYFCWPSGSLKKFVFFQSIAGEKKKKKELWARHLFTPPSRFHPAPSLCVHLSFFLSFSYSLCLSSPSIKIKTSRHKRRRDVKEPPRSRRFFSPLCDVIYIHFEARVIKSLIRLLSYCCFCCCSHIYTLTSFLLLVDLITNKKDDF